MNATESLAHHRAEIAERDAHAHQLTQRIADAQLVCDAGALAEAEVRAIREARRDSLADVHLGVGSIRAVEEFDAQLLRAETNARVAITKAEGASAASERLTAELDGMQPEFNRLHLALPALQFAAGLEHASEALPRYRAAVKEVAASFAILQGRCAAADLFSDLQADPRRMPTLNSGVTPRFSVNCPALHDAGSALDWVFDLTAVGDEEMRRTLEMLGGTESVAHVARQRASDAVDRAEASMRAQIAALDRKAA